MLLKSSFRKEQKIDILRHDENFRQTSLFVYRLRDDARYDKKRGVIKTYQRQP